jgi:transcriptional regulator of acetoin/glycerol metabolism
VIGMFGRYHWPGNIRQLANVLRTAAVMAGGDPQITELHLSDDFLEDVQRVPKAATTSASPSASAAASLSAGSLPPLSIPLPQPAPPAASAERAATLDEAERELIRQVLASVNGNISEASKRLGVSRNTIYRKLRRDEPGPG